jgi:ATP/ADP translocase
MRSPDPFVEKVFDVRRPELRRVLIMSTYLLLIIAAYSTVKAVRDSLFVTKIGPEQLPYVYLLIAGAMGVVSLAYTRAVNRIGLHRLIRTTSLIAISNLLLFWLGFRSNSVIWFYALYVWASIFGAITASQFWLLATHLFDAREARRVYSWIGVGGILGGVLGGALTNVVAHSLGTEALLIVCAGMMASTLVLLERLPDRKDPPPHPQEENAEGALFRQVRGSRYLTMMVLLLGVALIVEAFIDYQYKFVAKGSIASKDHLTAFFGSVTFYVGIASLLFQVLMTNRILKRFGVGWAILLLPSALLASLLTLAAWPSLWTAAALQLVDGAFSYSIHRSGMELLYLPIPPQTRNAIKGFIDMFVDRSGRAAGALLLLLLTVGLALSTSSLSLIAAGFVVAWIAMAVVVQKEYVLSFKHAVEKRTIEPEAFQLRKSDGATLKTLRGLLSSEDERQVLYALDLLSAANPRSWRGSINLLIQHPSRAVRARTIAALASWNDPAITRKEFTHHPDLETARIAAASALRLNWKDLPKERQLLNSLLYDSSPVVVREAIATAGIVGYRASWPLLIDKLADKSLRREARQAILKFDHALIPELVYRLSDNREPLAVRKRIPKTLALTGKQEAADALLQNLHRLDHHLDYLVLKALSKMRAASAEIRMDQDLVNAAIQQESDQYDRLRAIRAWLEVNPVDEKLSGLLMRALDEQARHRLERIVRLVALIHFPHDIYSVYCTCESRPALRPAAIEFLDNVLEAGLKEAVVPLLEEAFDPAMARQVRHPVQVLSLESALAPLLAGDDPWLKVIATELQKRDGEGFGERGNCRVINYR